MQNIVKKQIVAELHKPARVNFQRRKYVLKGIGETLQMDLVSLIQFKKDNRGYSFILVLIDTFSKFVLIEPLRTKTAKEVAIALEKLLNSYKYVNKTKFICADFGSEFYNKNVEEILKKRNIKLYSVFSKIKGTIYYLKLKLETFKTLFFACNTKILFYLQKHAHKKENEEK